MAGGRAVVNVSILLYHANFSNGQGVGSLRTIRNEGRFTRTKVGNVPLTTYWNIQGVFVINLVFFSHLSVYVRSFVRRLVVVFFTKNRNYCVTKRYGNNVIIVALSGNDRGQVFYHGE